MSLSNFKDFYLNSLIKDPDNDHKFDGSDEWLAEHTSFTKHGSIAISLFMEQYLTDVHVLPEVFNTIKKNENKEVVFITKNSEIENYIFESMCKKFPNRIIKVKEASENIMKDIRLIEWEDKIAVTTLDSEKIFSIKHIIELL